MSNNSRKNKRQKISDSPPLSIDMDAILKATKTLKSAKEAENWSKKQEATANAAYAERIKQGKKSFTVNSPDTVWRSSPVQLTSDEKAKSYFAKNEENFERAITFGGKKKSRKHKKSNKYKSKKMKIN